MIAALIVAAALVALFVLWVLWDRPDDPPLELGEERLHVRVVPNIDIPVGPSC